MVRLFAGGVGINYTNWVKNTAKINCFTNVKIHWLQMVFCTCFVLISPMDLDKGSYLTSRKLFF